MMNKVLRARRRYDACFWKPPEWNRAMSAELFDLPDDLLEEILTIYIYDLGLARTESTVCTRFRDLAQTACLVLRLLPAEDVSEIAQVADICIDVARTNHKLLPVLHRCVSIADTVRILDRLCQAHHPDLF